MISTCSLVNDVSGSSVSAAILRNPLWRIELMVHRVCTMWPKCLPWWVNGLIPHLLQWKGWINEASVILQVYLWLMTWSITSPCSCWSGSVANSGGGKQSWVLSTLWPQVNINTPCLVHRSWWLYFISINFSTIATWMKVTDETFQSIILGWDLGAVGNLACPYLYEHNMFSW